ncbi:MAG TPA: hypothetical protein VGY99_01205 [Candidatus Binataceae bacterium]|jgi:hypothetical protein|nr:hypothetical protein [Candidatus Binataceae bacterium]
MPFAAKDFYDLALWLSSQRPDESSHRTGISRIYYAAHLTARDKLSQKGWLMPSGKGDDHGLVIRELRRRRFSNRADELRYLKDLREHSDYHVDADRSVLNEDCQLCERIMLSSGAEVVSAEHLREALEVGQRLLPLLEKL